MEPLRFLETDINDRPSPGWYAGTIETACWRESSHNNRMVYLMVVLDGVGSPYDHISDYFVLEGVTQRGIACSRRRLVMVFRAAGLCPRGGDEILPGVLEGLKIEVKLAHELWDGKARLRITSYRPSEAASGPNENETDEDSVVGHAATPQDAWRAK